MPFTGNRDPADPTVTGGSAMSRTPKTDAFVAALRRRGVEVLTHDQWGSARRDLYQRRLTSHPHGLLPSRPVDTLWNHITVTEDDGPTVGEFKADCREVERIGYARFGSGVSYNVLIDRNAGRPRVAIGQFLEAKGTHTVNNKGVAGFSYNQNKVALALAWVGRPGDRLDTHAVEACVQVIAALIEVGALTDHFDNVPHSLVAAKDCPTDELRDRLASIKRRALTALTSSPVRYTAASARPVGREYHGPGHARSRLGLSLYHRGPNSFRGLRFAKRKGFSWVDVDGREVGRAIGRDGEYVAAHSDDTQRKEGFRGAGVPLRVLSRLTLGQVRRLRRSDGYVIRTIEEVFTEAKRLGLGVAYDIKTAHSRADVDRIIAMANRIGVRLYAKCDPKRPELVASLERFRDSGCWARFNGGWKWLAPR